MRTNLLPPAGPDVYWPLTHRLTTLHPTTWPIHPITWSLHPTTWLYHPTTHLLALPSHHLALPFYHLAPSPQNQVSLTTRYLHIQHLLPTPHHLRPPLPICRPRHRWVPFTHRLVPLFHPQVPSHYYIPPPSPSPPSPLPCLLLARSQSSIFTHLLRQRPTKP